MTDKIDSEGRIDIEDCIGIVGLWIGDCQNEAVKEAFQAMADWIVYPRKWPISSVTPDSKPQ